MYSEWRPTTGNLSRANTGRLVKVHDFIFFLPSQRNLQIQYNTINTLRSNDYFLAGAYSRELCEKDEDASTIGGDPDGH